MADESVAQDQLRTIIERVELMNSEADAIKADIKDIWAEAKGNGFEVKVLKRIVNIRKDQNEYAEQEAILDLYMSALGMIPEAAE